MSKSNAIVPLFEFGKTTENGDTFIRPRGTAEDLERWLKEVFPIQSNHDVEMKRISEIIHPGMEV